MPKCLYHLCINTCSSACSPISDFPLWACLNWESLIPLCLVFSHLLTAGWNHISGDHRRGFRCFFFSFSFLSHWQVFLTLCASPDTLPTTSNWWIANQNWMNRFMSVGVRRLMLVSIPISMQTLLFHSSDVLSISSGGAFSTYGAEYTYYRFYKYF
jgi:hypothetical protein